ncbi:unnamed protein product [Darwinula stevensoni]|uniref:4-coumarate--CoA ligase n=1 Tax=Darwinula stevensoni TaxID=69355 RepID=A0A7R8X720_9CRUS|nr:unnamed protein product [Darwinula stevensoni]CAG0886397.1 unnamed protein product [Darwinula stevensoni]
MKLDPLSYRTEDGIFLPREAAPPLPHSDLYDMLVEGLQKNYSKDILICSKTGETMSGRQVLEESECVARALYSRGLLSKGGMAAIVTPNCPRFAVWLMAILRLRAVLTMANPTYTEEEIARQLLDSGSEIVLGWEGILEKVQGAARKVPGLRQVITLGQKGSLTLSDLIKEGRFLPPVPQVKSHPDDVVLLPSSSGTTGVPKGVLITHRNMTHALVSMDLKTLLDLSPDDVVMVFLPLFHIYGCTLMAKTLQSGNRLVVMPHFDFVEMLTAIQEHHVTLLPLVPPVALVLSHHPVVDNFNLRSLRKIVSGAAPLSGELQMKVERRLKVPGYGMTEGPLACLLTPVDKTKPGSVGIVVPYFEVKLTNIETGKTELKEGELCIRGPQLMKGYLRREAETAATIDSSGWLHTGDVGKVDEDGYFYIIDRIKELIKHKGFQVAPAELEGLLLTHPEVIDAAVIGRPDTAAGELPTAFVVLKSGSNLKPNDIQSFVDKRVSSHKRLRGGVIITDAIPKSPSGKILRRFLRSSLQSKL